MDDDFMARAIEQARQERHHEVLCLVLRDSIAHTSEAQDANRAPDFVRLARLYADLAYPPPKAKCEHEWGSLMASFGHSRRCVKCNHVELIPPKAEGT